MGHTWSRNRWRDYIVIIRQKSVTVEYFRMICVLVGVLDSLFFSFSCFLQTTTTCKSQRRHNNFNFHKVLIAGFDSALETTQGHLLIVVVFILVIVAAVHLGGGVGDDTVGRGVEQAGSLLGHQQGGGVLNAAAFLHIVHLRRAGRDGGEHTQQTQTNKQGAKTHRAAPAHFLQRGIFVFNHLALHQRQKVQWSGGR